MEKLQLKTYIQEEIKNVTNMLISGGSTDAIILTKWLQSLQKIDSICKERNRY